MKPTVDQRRRDYAATKAEAHAQDRDSESIRVSEALDRLQPSHDGLGRFLDAVQHAYAVEAWATVQRQSPDNAMMALHHWAARAGTGTPHPVGRIIAETKATVARQVVEDLAKADLLDDRLMRIFVIGIWAVT